MKSFIYSWQLLFMMTIKGQFQHIKLSFASFSAVLYCTLSQSYKPWVLFQLIKMIWRVWPVYMVDAFFPHWFPLKLIDFQKDKLTKKKYLGLNFSCICFQWYNRYIFSVCNSFQQILNIRWWRVDTKILECSSRINTQKAGRLTDLLSPFQSIK